MRISRESAGNSSVLGAKIFLAASVVANLVFWPLFATNKLEIFDDPLFFGIFLVITLPFAALGVFASKRNAALDAAEEITVPARVLSKGWRWYRDGGRHMRKTYEEGIFCFAFLDDNHNILTPEFKEVLFILEDPPLLKRKEWQPQNAKLRDFADSFNVDDVGTLTYKNVKNSWRLVGFKVDHDNKDSIKYRNLITPDNNFSSSQNNMFS